MKTFKTAALAICACIGFATVAQAQVQPGIFGPEETRPGTSFGVPYLRFAIGGELATFEDAYWDPPGADDPRVFYDLPDERAAMGAIAFGYDWGKGLRGEIAIMGFGEKDVAAPWSYTEPATEGPHASMSATVRSGALMANAFVAPLEMQGNTGRFQPFVMAGIGTARNEMGDWTRTNPASDRVTRTFEGDTKSDLAWAVGFGFAYQLNDPGKKPIMLEMMYQHVDLGRAEGGSASTPGDGDSEPRTPFGFDIASDNVSVGIRIPVR